LSLIVSTTKTRQPPNRPRLAGRSLGGCGTQFGCQAAPVVLVAPKLAAKVALVASKRAAEVAAGSAG
jgi:hypothetical protein